MNPILGSTLWITLIGMGLVFIAILLLWGLMEVVVRATARSGKEASEAGQPELVETESEPPTAAETDPRKVRAAAVAVAYAIASHKQSISAITPPPAANGSAWQAVMRSFQINSRGQLSARKSRGK